MAEKAQEGPQAGPGAVKAPERVPDPLPVISGLYTLPRALPSLLSVIAQQALEGKSGLYAVKVWRVHG